MPFLKPNCKLSVTNKAEYFTITAYSNNLEIAQLTVIPLKLSKLPASPFLSFSKGIKSPSPKSSGTKPYFSIILNNSFIQDKKHG